MIHVELNVTVKRTSAHTTSDLLTRRRDRESNYAQAFLRLLKRAGYASRNPIRLNKDSAAFKSEVSLPVSSTVQTAGYGYIKRRLLN